MRALVISSNALIPVSNDNSLFILGLLNKKKQENNYGGQEPQCKKVVIVYNQWIIMDIIDYNVCSNISK